MTRDITRVELLGRYSNQTLLTRLERVLPGQNDDRTSGRSRTIVSRTTRKQKQVRLSDQDLDIAIAAYEAGLTLNEVSSSFGAHVTTLAKRMEQRGVPRRGRRLTQEQIQEAIDLYQQGWSLTRVGEHFGVHPESIRYRFKRAGSPLRPRPGWPREST